MITHRAIKNTQNSIGLKPAITRCKKVGLPIEITLYLLLGPEALRRYYQSIPPCRINVTNLGSNDVYISFGK